MKTGVNCTKNCKLYKKSYGYNTELFLIRKIWTTLGEEDHFSNIADMQPPHVPFTYDRDTEVCRSENEMNLKNKN